VSVRRRILTAIRHPVSQNAIAMSWMQIAQFVVPLVTLPYVARVLEPSAFGLVVFAQGFAFFLVVFIDWGFGFTGTRSTAENQGNPEELSKIVQRVRSAQLLLAGTSVPIALVALGLVPTMTRHPEFLAMAWVAAIASALTPGWFFLGIEEMRRITGIQLAVRVLGAALTFALVKDVGDAWIVTALFTASSVAGWALADVLLYRRVEFLRPRLRGTIREIRHASTIFVGMVGASLYGAFNVVLLGALQPSAAVAHFGVAERIVRVSVTVLSPIGMATYPRLVALQAAGKRERARKLLMLTVAAAAVPGMLIAVGLALLAPTVVGILFGERFVESTVPILRVLVLTIPVSFTGAAFGIWLITQHKDRVAARIVLTAGVANVALGTVLTLSFGPIGMAWSVVAAEGVAAIGAIDAVRRDTRRERAPAVSASPRPHPEPALPADS
jgi:polysaccharide transporter, PST family